MYQRRGAVRAGVVTVAGLLVLSGTSCQLLRRSDGREPPSSPTPCGGSPAARVELTASRPGQTPAFFESIGDPVYLYATSFEAGFLHDENPETTFLVGPAAEPSVYDAVTDTVTPVTLQRRAGAQEYVKADLPKGRYWLLMTNGARAIAFSCTPGGVTGIAATPASQRTP